MPITPSLLLTIAAGGAVGAVARFLLSSCCSRWLTLSTFPLGTLVVNVLGSFAIGCLYSALAQRVDDDDFWRPLLMTGFLGAFTTFSTFSIETVQLLQRGETAMALSYMLLSVLLCVAFAWLGLQLVGS